MLLRKWRGMCAASVVASLSLPAMAQEGEVIEEIQGTVTQEPAGGTVIQERGTQVPPSRQLPGQRPAGTRFAGQDGQQQGQLDDRALATWLLAGAEGEIKISEAVAQKTQNEEVKAFAQKMAEEHTQQAEQLRQIAMGGGQRGQQQPGQPQPGQPPRPGQPGQPNSPPPGIPQSNIEQPGSEQVQVSTLQQPQPGQPQPGARTLPGRTQPGARPQPGQAPDDQRGQARMMQSDNPAVALHQEIAEKCAQSKLQALQEAQGEELDHMYIHGQVAAHMTMKDTLEVIGQKASPQLKQLVAQSQQMADQHLQEAKQLEEQLTSHAHPEPESQPQPRE